jgi:hypothetical protein
LLCELVISGQRRGAQPRPRWASALVFIGRSSELFPSWVARSTPLAMRSNQSKRSPSTMTSGPLIAGIRVDGRRSVANRVAVRVLAASTGTNSRANWNFESSSLQRRVRLSPDFSFPCRKSPGFPPVCGLSAGSVVGRDAQGSATSRRAAVLSLSGDIPVPQCYRCGSRLWQHWSHARVGLVLGLTIGVEALSSDRLKRSRARSVAGPRQAADASAPAACLRSTHAADTRRGWLA